MEKISANLTDFKTALENKLIKAGMFKMSKKEALEKELCIICGEPALAKCTTDAGRKEFFISAYCEPCFDEAFPEE